MALTCLVGLAGQARGDLVAIWTFGPDASNYRVTPAFDATGSAALSAVGQYYDATGGNGVAFTDAGGTYRGAGQCLHWTDVSSSPDAKVEVSIDLSDWKDLSVRWDYKSDNSGSKRGPVRFDFDYRLDSGSWVNVTNNQSLTRDDAWHEVTLVLPAAVDGQTNVQIRWNDLKEDTVKDGEYWQDNIQLTGTFVPEPCSIAMLLVSGAWGFLIRRRTARG